MVLLIMVATSLGLFLIPSEAHAWGPIAHLDYASEALKSLSLYPAAVKVLLTQFPNDFLYGAVAADITVGKDYVDYIYNCHNWRMGFLILNEAKSDRQKAAAYGYLTHLACDIIAHNYFVPYKIIRSFPTRTLGHVYWEMRFDARRPQSVWKLATKIGKMDFKPVDELFQRVLKKTLFSFKTNKRIFNSILLFHRFEKLHRAWAKLSGLSRWTLGEEDINEYRRLVRESVTSFLKDPSAAPCLKIDPTGEAKLLYAKQLRAELKRLSRAGAFESHDVDRFLKSVKQALKQGIYQSVDLPDVSEIL